MSHNWSATKQRLHPRSVAEISRHSVCAANHPYIYLELSPVKTICKCVAVPEMLDPKARVRTDDGGAPFQWMSVPSVKEVAIQPATTDVFLQPAPRAEKHTDTVLSTR